MSAVSPLEDADSSQVHLLKGHIVPYSSTTPFVGGDITDEQEYIASNDRSNAGGRAREHLDNEHELDDLSRTPCVTGIIIREASTYNRKPKAKDLTELKGRENVLWVWILEMFLLCVAAGFFAAICLVLDKYNGEELPDWDLLGLTLKTLVSILGTFFRAILAVVTFEILAQRKWTWLSQDTSRPLRDIELFDSASRGVFGCLRLLPLVATREPVALGAATIAILSLAIGSFTQQSIQTYQCLREIETQSDAATIAIANTIYVTDFNGPSSQWKFNTRMQAAMRDAMVSPNDPSSLFNCPSGNCTFATYFDHYDYGRSMSHASLGICNTCMDLYDLVEQQRDPEGMDDRNYSLPIINRGGDNMKFIFNNSSSTYLNLATGMNLSWTERVATSEFLNRARWSITNITLLGTSTDHCDKLPDGNITCPSDCKADLYSNKTCDSYSEPSNKANYAAAACIIYPCLKYYNAEFKNSEFKENVVWEVPLRKQGLDYNLDEQLWSAEAESPLGDWKGIMQPCLVNGTVFTSLNRSTSAPVPNPTQLVFHSEDWASENIRSPSKGVNMTVPGDCVVELSASLVFSFQREFRDTYNFQCTYGWDDACGTTIPGTPSVEISSSPLFKNGQLSLQHINKTMESVTTRLTNEIRKFGRGPFSDAQPLVKGTAWGNRICVRIAWKWLGLPAALLIVSSLLLLLTMVRDAKRRNVWKSSIIPLLLKDHPGVERMGLKDLDKTAGSLEVKIQN